MRTYYSVKGSMSATVRWTNSGQTGMTAAGWMIRQTSCGFDVFDADDRYVGRFDTRALAEQAAR